MRPTSAHLLIRFVLLAGSVLVLAGGDASAARRATAPPPTSTGSLDAATKQWKALALDKRARTQKSWWLKAVAKLEAAAEGPCPTPIVALSRAAAACEQSSKFGTGLGAERCEQAWVRAAESCPADRQADDAWMSAAALAQSAGRAADARKYAENAEKMAGDRRGDARALLASLAPAGKQKPVARAESPVRRNDRAALEASLESATLELRALTAEKRLRGIRKDLVAVRGKLDAVADEAAAFDDLASLARMRAARAVEVLHEKSAKAPDAREAIEAYAAVAKRHPEASLADDALVAAARLAKSIGDTDAARTYYAAAAKLDGDQAAVAGRALAGLPETKEKEAVPAIAPAAVADGHGEFDALPEHLDVAPAGESFDRMGDLLAAMDVLAEPGRRTAAAETLKQVKKSVVTSGGLSLSEQVGLKVRRIVVDAGHGGHDTGAIGPTGVKEKDVTLAIANTLAEQLRGRGYEVVLTRDSDVFLALEERTALANKERGDLFISVHANAHKSRKKGGIETYSLNVTGDRYARRLAARENATTERTVSDLQFLLADLAVRANTADSRRLASLVQSEVVTQTKKAHGALRDLGTKQALFFVLLGARMPAVLVETAFLSNPAEEKRLADAKFQATVARAIADGVDAFVQRRTELASADW